MPSVVMNEVEFVEVLARTLPMEERRMLAGAGAGHVPQVSHPEEYVQAIASFTRHAELGEPEAR